MRATIGSLCEAGNSRLSGIARKSGIRWRLLSIAFIHTVWLRSSRIFKSEPIPTVDGIDDVLVALDEIAPSLLI
jgi:hypothetical protein